MVKSYQNQSIIFNRLKQSTTGLWSVRILLILVLIALFSGFLANDKPLYCKLDGKTHFPVFKSWLVDAGLSGWDKNLVNAEWKSLDYESVVFPPVPYLPTTQDLYNRGCVGPFDNQKIPSLRWKHWLGTDRLGRDVLAGMIHGTRTALVVGLISMVIASIIGLFFGSLAGYFGNNSFRPSRASIFSYSIGILLFIWWGVLGRARHWLFAEMEGNPGTEVFIRFLILVVFLFGAFCLSLLLQRISFFKKDLLIPVDSIILRLIEIFKSLPGLLVILALISLLKQPSIFYVMAIIGLLRWTSIAQYLRAELLKVREMEFIQSARVMGFSDWRIIFRHALPNAMTPVFITIAFGIASAILLEAFISFLGIGLAPEEVTWGSLLNDARQNFSAWWLALFPGLAIFITVTIFNLIGDALRRQKS
jgi:peptide/nickel transport system permease protein